MKLTTIAALLALSSFITAINAFILDDERWERRFAVSDWREQVNKIEFTLDDM